MEVLLTGYLLLFGVDSGYSICYGAVTALTTLSRRRTAIVGSITGSSSSCFSSSCIATAETGSWAISTSFATLSRLPIRRRFLYLVLPSSLSFAAVFLYRFPSNCYFFFSASGSVIAPRSMRNFCELSSDFFIRVSSISSISFRLFLAVFRTLLTHYTESKTS